MSWTPSNTHFKAQLVSLIVSHRLDKRNSALSIENFVNILKFAGFSPSVHHVWPDTSSRRWPNWQLHRTVGHVTSYCCSCSYYRNIWIDRCNVKSKLEPNRKPILPSDPITKESGEDEQERLWKPRSAWFQVSG